MSRIYLPSPGPEAWAALLADPVRHWRPRYSAHSAAHSWEAAQDLPPAVAALLGPDARLELAIPEHRVPMPGAGRDSQCDVFALVTVDGRLAAVAVEAKVDEPFGPTLGEWLEQGGNRRLRLDTICGWLGRAEPPPGLRYQLFHRTAAAIVEARRFHCPLAAMVVQAFPGQGLWRQDFADFAAWLGVEAPPGTAGRMMLPDGIELILGWADCPFPEAV